MQPLDSPDASHGKLARPLFLGTRVWRYSVNSALSGAQNMAIDDALMHRAGRSGEGVFRIYRWREPTLSLGRHQRARDAYDSDKAASLGVALVRRMTGGRALLHWREVTYSVTAPIGPEPLHVSYAAINALLLEALASLGVVASIAPRTGRLPPPGSAPCFELPAEGEILVGQRKLVGSAQLRDNHSMLQHGSILIADDQPLVGQVAHRPVSEPAPAATLASAIGREPSFEEVADALLGALAARVDRPTTSFDLTEIEDDVRPRTALYAGHEWTWRR